VGSVLHQWRWFCNFFFFLFILFIYLIQLSCSISSLLVTACYLWSESHGLIQYMGSIAINVAILSTRTQQICCRASCNVTIDVWRGLCFWGGPFLDGGGLCRFNFLLRSAAALGEDVRCVVEMQEKEKHGPGIVESDCIVEPWVVAVGAYEHVVAGVTHDCYELCLQIIRFNRSTSKVWRSQIIWFTAFTNHMILPY